MGEVWQVGYVLWQHVQNVGTWCETGLAQIRYVLRMCHAHLHVAVFITIC